MQATGRMTRRALLPTVAALLALAAAGCGGSSDDKSNEAYANSVCGAISSWETQIKSIATDFSGGVSKDSLQSKITEAESATKALATQIKAVPPPNSSQGQAAKQQLDQLSTDITATVSAVTSAADQIQADATAATLSAQIAVLTPQIKNLATESEAAVTSLKSAGGSLASAFKSADACQSLG